MNQDQLVQKMKEFEENYTCEKCGIKSCDHAQKALKKYLSQLDFRI